MYVIKMLCQMFSLSLGAFCLSLKHHSYHHEEFSRKKIGPYLSDSDRKKIAMAKITSDQLRDEVDRFLNDIGDVGNITIGGVPFFFGGGRGGRFLSGFLVARSQLAAVCRVDCMPTVCCMTGQQPSALIRYLCFSILW